MDDIIDHLNNLGMIRHKKTVNSILERLVNTNFVRKIDRKDKYYRTQEMDFDVTVDPGDLKDACKESISLNFPGEVEQEYNKLDLSHYTCYETGEVKKLETN